MRRISGIIIMILIGCCMTMTAQEVENFVKGQLERYPQARLLDIYKSCFQDYMGAEHLVNDTASARAYLEQEIAASSLDGMMPWYSEPCGIDGNYIRVSLRAVHEGFITADMLLNAFVASANAERPSVGQWAGRWLEIVTVIDGMGLDLPHYQEDKEFIDGVLSKGKYAISHSREYREAYSPHYRIISHDIFERDIQPRLPKP